MTLDINSEIYDMEKNKEYYVVLSSAQNISDGKIIFNYFIFR